MNTIKSKRPLVIPSILRSQCPNCRRGYVFANKSVFPLGKALQLKQRCSNCNQQLIDEMNNGGGINFVLTVIVFFLNLLWYWPIFGISYKDNSIVTYLIVSIVVVSLMQPWMMRLSRVIYLYFFIPFGSNKVSGASKQELH